MKVFLIFYKISEELRYLALDLADYKFVKNIGNIEKIQFEVEEFQK